MRKIYIYTLGLVPLVLLYQYWKDAAPNSIIFVLGTLAYFTVLRLIADTFGKQ